MSTLIDDSFIFWRANRGHKRQRLKHQLTVFMPVGSYKGSLASVLTTCTRSVSIFIINNSSIDTQMSISSLSHVVLAVHANLQVRKNVQWNSIS